MISDDMKGVAAHMRMIVDGRGRLRLGADGTRATLDWLDTMAEQVARLERNAVRLDDLPMVADDPVRMVRALETLAKKARGLAQCAERWDPGALRRGQDRRIDAAVTEVAGELHRILDAVAKRAPAAPAETCIEKRINMHGDEKTEGAQVVSLAARRAERGAPAARTGPGGSAA